MSVSLLRSLWKPLKPHQLRTYPCPQSLLYSILIESLEYIGEDYSSCNNQYVFFCIDESQQDVDMMEIDKDLIAEAEKAWDQRSWTIEHILFPALKLFLKPPRQMATDGTAIQVKKHI